MADLPDSGGIKIVPAEVEGNAEEIRAHAARIQAAVDAVDAQIQQMNESVFAGNMANELRTRYANTREAIMNFTPMLNRYAETLDEAAAAFRGADNAATGGQ